MNCAVGKLEGWAVIARQLTGDLAPARASRDPAVRGERTWGSPSCRGWGLPSCRVWSQPPPACSRNSHTWDNPRARRGPVPLAGTCNTSQMNADHCGDRKQSNGTGTASGYVASVCKNHQSESWPRAVDNNRKLTTWNRVPPEKLTRPESRNSLHFMEHKGSLPHSQKPVSSPCPETVQSSPCPHSTSWRSV